MAALTTLYTVLAAVYGVVASAEILPDKVVAGLGIFIAVLAAALGALTHQKVTPLVDPKDNDGRRLEPVDHVGRHESVA